MIIRIPYWPGRAVVFTASATLERPAPAKVNNNYLTSGYSGLRLGASRPVPGPGRVLPARGLFVDELDQEIEERRTGVRIGGAP